VIFGGKIIREGFLLFFYLDTKEPKDQVSINLPPITHRTPARLTTRAGNAYGLTRFRFCESIGTA
jgi:hypothetical protein